MNLIGLDISTSITGWTIIDKAGTVMAMDHIDLRKHKGLWNKVDYAMAELDKVLKQYNIENVFIEESLQRFRPGFSSAHTLMTLAKFNGLLAYSTRNITKADPVCISAHDARTICNIPLNRKKGSKKIKLQVFDWVTSMLNKSWPVTRYGNIQPWCYDEADSYVIALAGFKKMQNG